MQEVLKDFKEQEGNNSTSAGAQGKQGHQGARGNNSTFVAESSRKPRTTRSKRTSKYRKRLPRLPRFSGKSGTNALNSSGKLVITNSNLHTREHASTLLKINFPLITTMNLLSIHATDQLMWIGREDLNYNGIVISNNSLTGKGSKVQCQVHRHINGNKSDTVGERYLSGSMMVQTLVEDKGTNYSYAPRMALTYQNFNAQAWVMLPQLQIYS